VSASGVTSPVSVAGVSPLLPVTSPVCGSIVMRTRSYATPSDFASITSLSPAPERLGTRVFRREWVCPAITTSTAPVMSRASSTISPAAAPEARWTCFAPEWASTTIASTPSRRNAAAWRFTVSEMSRKSNRSLWRASR
jgi:hypothetical protein